MNDLYRTRDLSEAAALFINKQHLIKIERVRKICWFIFENKQECEQISHEFFFGELMVNAREYHQAMTHLKNRIFAER